MTIAQIYSPYPVTDPLVQSIDAENKCSPNLVLLREHLIKTWGGMHLGCYIERPIRGGTTRSIHWYGAATDWRYENPGIGRATMLNEVLPWLIGYSYELGIDAIHDYVGAQIWHAGRGWRTASRDSLGFYNDPNMGKAYAQWLHIETHPLMWYCEIPIADRFTITPTLPPIPPTPTYPPGWFTVNAIRYTVKLEDKGKMVKRCQDACKTITGAPTVNDSYFGPQTEEAIKNLQRFFGLTIDGICGPKTWDVLETITND